MLSPHPPRLLPAQVLAQLLYMAAYMTVFSSQARPAAIARLGLRGAHS